MTKSHSPLRRRDPCLLTPFRLAPSLTHLRRPTPTERLHGHPSDYSLSKQERPRLDPSLDVLGLGEAMIDFGATVSDEVLQEFGVVKGGRRIIDSDERLRICRRLNNGVNVSPGSSLGNTLAAMSQLSQAFGKKLELGFAGCIGDDHDGRYYASYLKGQGVEVMDCATKTDGQMGCVIVMVTHDAQRSFLADPGEGRLRLTDDIRSTIVRSKAIVVEGYLFDQPEALETITDAVELAKRHETMVILTTGDAEIARKSKAAMWEVISMGVDVLLCNRSEATALLGDEGCCAYEAVKRLGQHCPLVAVTDGSRGSYVMSDGQLVTVPPCWTAAQPVDTCGAGDVYAAGLLVGRLLGYDLHRIGRLAARSASSIIVKHGTQLTQQEAIDVVTDVQEKSCHIGHIVYR